MKKLHITAYVDDRPGHEKQTMAIIQALALLTPIDSKYVPVSKACTSSKTTGTSAKERASRDLLIGSGRKTHLPLLLHKMRTGGQARVICCMGPPAWLRPFFDLCLIPNHDKPCKRANVFPTIGPPCLPKQRDRQQNQRGLILVGGVDHKSHHWNEQEIITQIRTLLAHHPERQWTISSSPRTPPTTMAQLASLSKREENKQAGIDFFRSEDTPPGWIEEQYEINYEVWVSADSVSMVYEALSAGCRVGVLPVKWRRPTNKFQRGLDELWQKGLVLPYSAWRKGITWPDSLPALNEAERCAREILRRWWPERLP